MKHVFGTVNLKIKMKIYLRVRWANNPLNHRLKILQIRSQFKNFREILTSIRVENKEFDQFGIAMYIICKFLSIVIIFFSIGFI